MVEAVVIVHNQLEELKLCMQTFAMFADGIPFRFYVLDNGSNDGTWEWLDGQRDVCCERVEFTGSAGTLLNKALALREKGDGEVLLLCPNLALTPGALGAMLTLLYEREDNGIVAPLLNISKESPVHPGNFAEAIEAVKYLDTSGNKVKVGLDTDVLFIRQEVLDKVGSLEECFATREKALLDLQLRAIGQGYRLLSCAGALFYRMSENDGWDKNEAAIRTDRFKMKQKWGMNYFNKGYNRNLLGLLQTDREESFRVLEIGCDCGANLLEIADRYPHCEVYGAELNPDAARIAGHLLKVCCGNVEEEKLPYEDGFFDYIFFGDVLEHLHDPLSTLQYCRRLLKTDGRIIASIPNLMHVSVLRELLSGNFTYEDVGLLDKTHIHLFTYNEILRMFERAGYRLLTMEGVNVELPEAQHRYIDVLMGISAGAQRFMFETYQFVLEAQKREPRVLLFTGENEILDYTAGRFCSALEEMGAIVHTMDINRIQREADKLDAILDQGIDFAIVFNNRGWLLKMDGKSLWDSRKIPCYNYILDHPFYYFDTMRQAPAQGRLLCVDRRHVEYVKEFYPQVKNCAFLPLGGELLQRAHKSLAERPIDVLFVGTYKQREDYGFEGWQQEAVEELLAHPERTTEEAITRKYRAAAPEAGREEIRQAIEDNRIIDMYMKFHYRAEAVRELVENGIRVTVYGRDWERAEFAGNPNFIYGGSLPQKEVLEKMQDSKLVLNVMPWFKDGIHDRVLNAMLSGCVSLTDDSGYLSEQFAAGSDYVSFELNRMETLPATAGYLLTHPEEAQRIADSGHVKSLEHTWEARLKEHFANGKWKDKA